MKHVIIILVLFVCTIDLYSQTNMSNQEPKGMKFVPMGSFRTILRNVSQQKETVVTVDPFWMSNEITNKEFREFVTWARNNPDKTLNETLFVREKKMDPVTLIEKDTIYMKVNPIEVSSFIGTIIDQTSMEKENKEIVNYFNGPDYDEFPVVGVSCKIAKYYCLWRTTLENDSLRKKGLPAIQVYRLPFETEWEYAAQKIRKGPSETLKRLHKVNEGSPDDYGIFGLGDNVSEWVISTPGLTPVIRGGSWNSGSNVSYRQETDINFKDASTGFRIVRSYISGLGGIGRIR